MSGLCARERSLFGDGILITQRTQRYAQRTQRVFGLVAEVGWRCLFLVEALLSKGYEV